MSRIERMSEILRPSEQPDTKPRQRGSAYTAMARHVEKSEDNSLAGIGLSFLAESDVEAVDGGRRQDTLEIGPTRGQFGCLRDQTVRLLKGVVGVQLGVRRVPSGGPGWPLRRAGGSRPRLARSHGCAPGSGSPPWDRPARPSPPARKICCSRPPALKRTPRVPRRRSARPWPPWCGRYIV